MTEQREAPTRRGRPTWQVVVLLLAAALVSYALLIVQYMLVEGAIVWQQVDKEVEALRATGYPISAMDLAEAMPPADQNAAPLYEQAWAKLQLSKADEDALNDIPKQVLAAQRGQRSSGSWRTS